MANKKGVLTKSVINKKDFSYEKAGTTLTFTLRTDNSSEMRAFMSCLEQAIKDIEKLLEGVKN